jgi:hypothetical protein
MSAIPRQTQGQKAGLAFIQNRMHLNLAALGGLCQSQDNGGVPGSGRDHRMTNSGLKQNMHEPLGEGPVQLRVFA